MSNRSGYTDDCDNEDGRYAMWRGAVMSAVRGKRGQAFLREMRDAMDAMPEGERRLIPEELVSEDGERCAMGCVAVARKMDVSNIDPEDYDAVAEAFGVNAKLVQEIAWENDDSPQQTPEDRWRYMRRTSYRQAERA